MQVVLQMWEESASGAAADRGNLVHSAVHAFHQSTGDRVAQGLAALEAAREKFPTGDPKEAAKIFGSYAADPENANAKVRWIEQRVTLRLPCAPEDPTGKDVVFTGTLDQVRETAPGLRVWDVKTGEAKDGPETGDEYAIQQAVYTLAAIQTLDPSIRPGGLIWTPGYKLKRKVHLSLKQTVRACKILLAPLVHWVASVRRGEPVFRPSADNCKYCPFKRWPDCLDRFEGQFGRLPESN